MSYNLKKGDLSRTIKMNPNENQTNPESQSRALPESVPTIRNEADPV